MKQKRQLILAIFSLLTMGIYAQSYQVTGTVTNVDNQPLPGVSVTIEGTSRGTTTDFDGNYNIRVESSENLIFSYVGFNDKKLQMDGTLSFDVIMISGVSLNEVVVVGSRNPNRTAVDTAVPVDIIDVTELITAGPQVNLNQILNYVAPSFTSNTQTISDGTDHIDPASLRGLGPDQVLVLINGKRRHTSSLINVNGTFGRGSVGTDLNAIPAASIERIEVLRDGAAAQYGSDAIAGVINIVLKRSTNELTMNITSGAYFSENSNDQTGGSDGSTTNVSANYGLQLGDKGGFLNFTGDFDVRDPYSRMKEFEGGIFNLYNTVERFADNAGYDLSNLLDDDVSDVIQYGNAAGLGLSPSSTKSELQSILSADNTTSELAARGLDRSDFNMRVGQSALRGGRFFANFSLPLNDDGTELYSFAGVSSRVGNSAGFYRLPSQSRTYTPAYINGFLPEINSAITDKSFSVGIKGKVSEWDVDFSNTYGKNEFLYTIGNTFNASKQSASPTKFDAGGFSFAQNTTNLDISKFYDDVMSGVNVAFGSEYRIETYEIYSGEEASYAQYTDDGQVITLDSQDPSVDFFGASRPGGSQVFPGFSPANELSRGRSSVAGYLDVEADISESFLLSLATRYEDYSDFGSTLNFKVASRIKAGENTNIRAAVNTGFRAPSLHQLNFNSTSTIFDQNGDPIEVGTFANDSRAAQLLGIPQLKEETSSSVSIGFTSKFPDSNITLTVDGYWVGIDDRVVYTGRFSGPGTGTELDKLLSQANAGAAAFFANAIDTESKGLDVVITHDAYFGDNTKLKTDFAATFSNTKRVGDVNASQVLIDAGKVDTYFDEASRVYLEEAVPTTKVNLSHSLTTDKFNVFLRNVYFGEVTEATNNVTRQQVFGTKVVTDLSFGYKATESLTITVGANNLLDVEPDRAAQEFSDGGTNRSSGRFDWSRRAQQFGVGGRFLFARLNFVLK
ncbi:TonB-dependent receptor [Lutibacter flavus]|uniref:Iron complex outermembrane recepter protein n=1 Tax=Lutibacter flavus TaxID=691689 RepID=A0A238VKT1_9FLAO|nr:TonB-dependent receptor [Lutibacter flavus]SNR34323.1 iron complex outermembrane recepter protein [Lutibacter flavus]